jgi:hypothetical protein
MADGAIGVIGAFMYCCPVSATQVIVGRSTYVPCALRLPLSWPPNGALHPAFAVSVPWNV